MFKRLPFLAGNVGMPRSVTNEERFYTERLPVSNIMEYLLTHRWNSGILCRTEEKTKTRTENIERERSKRGYPFICHVKM